MNYEHFILRLVVTSNFAQRGLVVLLLYAITSFVRLHISIMLCTLITLNNVVDLFSPILVSVFLYMISDNLYKYVETHRPAFERWVDYFVVHYSEENFIRWKGIFSLGICVYMLIGLLFVQIDNYYIFLTIMQMIASSVICDLLERKMPQILYNKLTIWLNRPRINKITNRKAIIPDYLSQSKVPKRRSLDDAQFRRQLVKPIPIRIPIPALGVSNMPISLTDIIPPKPPTPPLQVNNIPIPLTDTVPLKPLTPPLMSLEEILPKSPTPPLLSD